MIDTHCHLDVAAFAADVDAVVARATAAGVIGMLVPAIRPRMWAALQALSAKYHRAGMRHAIGVHPQVVPDLAPDELLGLEERIIVAATEARGRAGVEAGLGAGVEAGLGAGVQAGLGAGVQAGMHASMPAGMEVGMEAGMQAGTEEVAAAGVEASIEAGVQAGMAAGIESGVGAVAVGECGLDGATGERARQEEVFRAHIRAARVLGAPLVVHVFRAHDVAPRILREEGAREVGGVMHSYSGGADLVRVYRELGMAFSFAGPVTYPNARRPLEAVRAVPLELLLAETDAPDQAPAAERGQRSEPAFVRHVLAGLAAATGKTMEEIVAVTTANARRVFRTW